MASILASVSGAGPITIDEADAVTLTSVTTANGSITIIAGGAILATSVVSSTTTTGMIFADCSHGKHHRSRVNGAIRPAT